ncbi:hypothetical protein DY000_02031227 [Brassica cretica]|uniref:Uncharacterized protein n=1 Tax=Brassica cretica TaxID=69181 RepID=A0ABQ7DMI2_BRACR|nr:hypothetical protein DY000_02031227 [Brassica cretica]
METEKFCASCIVSVYLTHQYQSARIALLDNPNTCKDKSSSVVSSLEVSLPWSDGPTTNGELACTLLLLEQRHLDTLAQMAVRASTTTRWESPSGHVDMSGIGGNGGSAASG